MEKHDTESTPMKAVLEELDHFEANFRETLQSYATRLETEIAEVREKITAATRKKKISHTRLHEVRDMLTVLRTTQVKVDKGRRKDLKKMDGVVGDLKMLTENW